MNVERLIFFFRVGGRLRGIQRAED
jgi:hypothetical protein